MLECGKACNAVLMRDARQHKVVSTHVHRITLQAYLMHDDLSVITRCHCIKTCGAVQTPKECCLPIRPTHSDATYMHGWHRIYSRHSALQSQYAFKIAFNA